VHLPLDLELNMLALQHTLQFRKKKKHISDYYNQQNIRDLSERKPATTLIHALSSSWIRLQTDTTPSITETVQQFSKADTNNFSLNWEEKKRLVPLSFILQQQL
jgi:CRISPR/Cas system CMR-associated protein Cmr5 small subunit